jgi:hypothetical protein
MEQPIEQLKPISVKEGYYLRFKEKIRRMTIAGTVAAATGLTVGHLIQKEERGITGYSPSKHAELIESMTPKAGDLSFEEFRKAKKTKEKNGIQGWFSNIKEKIQQKGENPMKYIEDTETYKSILLKYYNSLKFIDDASFLLPAILMFIMLGSYISKKLKAFSGDVVAKKQNEEIIVKINELVLSANQIRERLESSGSESFSQEELEGVRALLLCASEALPNETEIDFIL